MSNVRYERLWRKAEDELHQVLEDDKAIIAEDVIEDREGAQKRVAKNYIRYIMCANKLNVCYDQIIHPDKRQIIKTLFEATLGRLLEVKQELVAMFSSDYSYLDNILLEMKLTRYDTDIQIPRFYRRDRAEELQNMFKNIDHILEEYTKAKLEETESGDAEGGEKQQDKTEEENLESERREEEEKKKKFKRPSSFKKVVVTEEQKEFIKMISLIQRHERARVARLEVREILDLEKLKTEIAWLRYVPPPADKVAKCARYIQRFWRGYQVRHKRWCHEHKVRELIGELRPSWRSHETEDLVDVLEEKRRVKQKDAASFAEESKGVVMAAIKRKEEDILEDIGDELRWYIENWYRVVGELPEFPEYDKILPPDNLLGIPKGVPKDFAERKFTLVPSSFPGIPPHVLGGSALIVGGFWIDPELYKLAFTAAKVERLKNPKGQAKAKLTKEQIKEMKEAEKEKQLAEKEAKKNEMEEKTKMGYVPKETKILVPMEANLQLSKATWGDVDDLATNPHQKHRNDLLLAELTKDQHFKLREVIDDLMRLELVQLQEALDTDRKKKKKGKGKKKKKKGKGKKGPKDPTKDRTTESLFQELVEKGIIRKYSEARIDLFFGDYSWNNHELQRNPFYQDPLPGLGDVRQVIKEYCILPLGSAVVHRTAPLVRSVMLFGHRECGHQFLVNSVCTETGAVLFDLTPSNTVGKYPGAKGKKMLVHLVSKMSRILQPSIILVEGAEKIFYKKVPKPERANNPKLLKKNFPKMVKEVKPEDQVLFLGTCEEPWLASGPALAKSYNKIILIPRPDYGSSSRYWFEKLMCYHGVSRDFGYSSLVGCAPGYSFPAIDRIIGKVFTARRIIALKYRPLQQQEILDEVLKEEPVSDDLHQKMVTWYNNFYPLAKASAEKRLIEEETRQKMAAVESKQKQRNKK